jgi:hypothetical protein
MLVKLTKTIHIIKNGTIAEKKKLPLIITPDVDIANN